MNFAYCPACGKKDSVKELDATNYECMACKWHFWNNAKGSIGLAFVKDGQLLFCKRGREPFKGMYDLPGGFVDFAEDAYAAASREANEELQVTIKKQDLEVVDVYCNRDYLPGISTIDVIFLVRSWSGELRADGEEVTTLEWKPFSFINDPAFCETFYTGLDKALEAKLAQQPGR